MTAPFTCHRPRSSGGYDHYGSQPGKIDDNRHSLHPDPSTLASTPLYSEQNSSLVLVQSLDIPSRKIATKPHSDNSFDLPQVAERVYILPTVSDSVQSPSSKVTDSMEEPTTPPPPSPQNIETINRKRTVSPKSPGELRSASRSTRRSGPSSRPSSLHSHRRTATTVSLTPSVPDSPIPRESLLALHRESCRLFQDHDLGVSPPLLRRSASPQSPQTPPRTARNSSNLGSPSSPLENQPSTTPTLHPTHLSHSAQDPHLPVLHDSTASTIDTKPIVIEWTSPSTRRREYEAIDRASSGVRGLWRRIAPRWCQFGESRIPFFKEGKNGKANYEGSVRRFRMDLDDDEPETSRTQRGLKLKPRFVVHAIESRRKRAGYT